MNIPALLKKTKLSLYSVAIISIVLVGFSIPIYNSTKSIVVKKIEESKRSKTPEALLLEETKDKILIFYSPYGTRGVMAIDFLSSLDYPYEARREGEPSFYGDLKLLKSAYSTSYGSSDSFEFYPYIFYKDKAYSGFDNKVMRMILEDLGMDIEDVPNNVLPCYVNTQENEQAIDYTCGSCANGGCNKIVESTDTPTILESTSEQ